MHNVPVDLERICGTLNVDFATKQAAADILARIPPREREVCAAAVRTRLTRARATRHDATRKARATPKSTVFFFGCWAVFGVGASGCCAPTRTSLQRASLQRVCFDKSDDACTRCCRTCRRRSRRNCVTVGNFQTVFSNVVSCCATQNAEQRGHWLACALYVAGSGKVQQMLHGANARACPFSMSQLLRETDVR